jgi:hypothetical protein
MRQTLTNTQLDGYGAAMTGLIKIAKGTALTALIKVGYYAASTTLTALLLLLLLCVRFYVPILAYANAETRRVNQNQIEINYNKIK